MDFTKVTTTVKDKNCVRHIRFSSSGDTAAENDDSIIVYARLKPLDLKDPSECSILRFDSSCISFTDKDKTGGNKVMNYSFHKVFAPTINQRTLFQTSINHHVEQFIAGNNRLVFAYGTSSSGKTYTIKGDMDDPGIIPRFTVKLFITLEDYIEQGNMCPDQGGDLRILTKNEAEEFDLHRQILLKYIEQDSKRVNSETPFCLDPETIERMVDKLLKEVDEAPATCIDPEAKYSVWLSYMEVYNENIYDLFDIFNADKKPLKIGLDSKRDNFVKGLIHVQVTSWLELWNFYMFGCSRLHTNQTQLNKSSSRSHSIFTIKLVKNVENKFSFSSLTFCDLAGSERQKKALNVGESLVESKSINSSLVVLNRCFMAVRENKVAIVKRKPPYRESKLTQIFQRAFSYSELITMYVTLSQSISLLEETKHVLRMSAVAQEMVKTLPKAMSRFVKPHSRFSTFCLNPALPISSFSNYNNISGVTLLKDSVNSTNASNEIIKDYELKISQLKEEAATKDKDIKSLNEMLEDAREEYINLEQKYEDLEKKLEEELILYDNLQAEYDDFKISHESQANLLQNFQEENIKLREMVKELEEKNLKASEEQKYKDELISKFKSKLPSEKLPRFSITSKPRTRGLLKNLILLSPSDPSEDSFIKDIPPSSSTFALDDPVEGT